MDFHLVILRVIFVVHADVIAFCAKGGSLAEAFLSTEPVLDVHHIDLCMLLAGHDDVASLYAGNESPAAAFITAGPSHVPGCEGGDDFFLYHVYHRVSRSSSILGLNYRLSWIARQHAVK